MYTSRRYILLLYSVALLNWLCLVPSQTGADDAPFGLDALKPLLDGVKILDPNQSPIKPFIEMFLPEKTTTTTTVSPIQEVAQAFIKFPASLPAHFGADLLKNSPLAVGNSALAMAGKALLNPRTLRDVTMATGKILGQLAGIGMDRAPEAHAMYYEYRNGDEPYGFRQHKYFSRECQFRFACELGKMMKPFTFAVGTHVERIKLIQDLQSRYTRAITFGMVHGDCERYYCLLKQLFGGPVEFAGAMAELVNRIANPDMY